MPKDLTILELKFERCICAAQIYSRRCLLIAGSGDQPDYTRLELSGVVRLGEWHAPVHELMNED